jgi:hypothetical protein
MESFVALISTFKNSIAGACITLQSGFKRLSDVWSTFSPIGIILIM